MTARSLHDLPDPLPWGRRHPHSHRLLRRRAHVALRTRRLRPPLGQGGRQLPRLHRPGRGPLPAVLPSHQPREAMNITTNDIIDSLMRTAFEPSPVPCGVDGQGQTIWMSRPSVAQPIVETINQALRNDPVVREALVTALVDRAPDVADAVAKLLPAQSVAVKQGQYGAAATVTVAEWLKPALTEALTEALREPVAKYVAERFEGFDPLDITVNVSVAKR